MRLVPSVACAAALVILAGCAGSTSPTTPQNATPTATTALGAPLEHQGILEAPLALYTLDIDPANLSATATLKESRQVQATDDVYLLSIDNFLRADSFAVEAVSRSAETLDISYIVAHPFPAPADLSGLPNGFSNRADLGIAGRVLFLVDVPLASPPKIGGATPISAEVSLVANADAYFAPAGLLDLTTVANAFPYKVLVDESGPEGSRIGVSNGGNPTGNYGNDGWTGLEMGSLNDQWSGYGVLHQGQRSRNTLSLSLDALAGLGAMSLDVAILAKYNDPRGGASGAEKKANRLPTPSADHTRFAYRMPHGALDVEKIEYLGQMGDFVENEAGSATLAFRITDWDARATETSLSDLAEDPVLTNVALGEAGLPGIELAIPGVLGDADAIEVWVPQIDILDDDTLYGGDAAADSGQPGDGLVFARIINKTTTSGETAGTYTGFVRVTDPEDSLGVTDWKFPLDPSLMPLSTNLPRPVTYQAFPVELETPVSATGWGTSFGGADSNTYGMSMASDSTGALYICGYFSNSTVNFGGGAHSTAGSSDIYLVKLDAGGTFQWEKIFGNSQAQIAHAVAVDSLDNVYVGGQFRGDLDFGGGLRSAPTSNANWVAKYDSTGTFLWDYLPNGQGASNRVTGLQVDSANNLVGTILWSTAPIDFGGGSRFVVGAGAEAAVVKLSPAGVYQWDNIIAGNNADVINGMDIGPGDQIWVAGYFSTDSNIFGNPHTAIGGQTAFYARLNASGAYQSHAVWTNTAGATNEFCYDIAVNPVAGNAVAGGYFSGDITIGSDYFTTTGSNDAFLANLDGSGNVTGGRRFGSTFTEEVRAIEFAQDGSGNYFVAGHMNGALDFGLGSHSPPSFRSSYLVKYSPTDTPIWNSYIDSTDFPGGPAIAQNGTYAIALDPNSNVFICGYFHKQADVDPGVGVWPVTTATPSLPPNAVYLSKIIGSTGLW